uniref:Uncharacterized protein n=1 Tax=Oryza meridionalis TaxID=40149 RepID=A0A0E0E512_9ORYZ
MRESTSLAKSRRYQCSSFGIATFAGADTPTAACRGGPAAAGEREGDQGLRPLQPEHASHRHVVGGALGHSTRLHLFIHEP